MIDWFGKKIILMVEPNPMVSQFGRGPEGLKCKDCANLFRKKYNKTYIKCYLRGNTNGSGTDHRARWNACSKFERRDCGLNER